MRLLSDQTLVARALARLAREICRHPRLFFYPHVLLFGLSIFITVEFLQFNTRRDNLVGANKKYHQNFLRLKKLGLRPQFFC